MNETKMHYRIKLIGDYRVPQKPWLALGMEGNFHFASESYAHKFATIEQAKEWLDYLKGCGRRVYMTWHDTSKSPVHGSFGEVNRDFLAKMETNFFEPWN